MNEKPIEIPGVGSVLPSSPEAAWLGPLLGMAVGDALGTTYEFERIEQPPYPALATGPAIDVVGGGPFNLVAGQVTDDTQMAVCLARSLVERAPAAPAPAAPAAAAPAPAAPAPAAPALPEIDMLDLATRYVAWYQHAFDVGNQTSSALSAIEQGTPIADAGRAVWHRSGRRAAGNGSLMRTTPIGVMFAQAATHLERPDLLVEAALTDSLITHADPRCALACAAFDLAIAHATSAALGAARDAARAGDRAAVADGHGTSEGRASAGGRAVDAGRATVDGRAMVEAGRAGIGLAATRLRELWSDDRDDLAAIDSAVVDLGRDLDAALADDPQLYSDELHIHRTAGFVRVAFRLAFWHAVHTPSWRDAVIDVASRGGDADTNAAIVGALLGARDGVHAIPAAWIDRVLAVTQPGPPDWAAAHHPRHLLASLRGEHWMAGSR